MSGSLRFGVFYKNNLLIRPFPNFFLAMLLLKFILLLKRNGLPGLTRLSTLIIEERVDNYSIADLFFVCVLILVSSPLFETLLYVYKNKSFLGDYYPKVLIGLTLPIIVCVLAKVTVPDLNYAFDILLTVPPSSFINLLSVL